MNQNTSVLSYFFNLCQDEQKYYESYKSKVYSQIQVEQMEKILIQYLLNSLYLMLSPLDQLEFLQDIKQDENQKLPIVNEDKNVFLHNSLLLKSDQNKQQLKDWIKFKVKKTNLLYRGTRDGFQHDQFYQRCSEKGPTLTLIKSKEGQNLFGGFTAQSWTVSNNGWISKTDLDAFVFSQSHGKKHELYAEQSNSISMFNGHKFWGLCFGGIQIKISNKCNENALSQWDIGKYYKLTSGYHMEMGKTQLVGSYNFTVEEIEVYQVKME